MPGHRITTISRWASRMGKFPETTAGAEVVETNLDQDDFQFQGQRLTEERAEESH